MEGKTIVTWHEFPKTGAKFLFLASFSERKTRHPIRFYDFVVQLRICLARIADLFYPMKICSKNLPRISDIDRTIKSRFGAISFLLAAVPWMFLNKRKIRRPNLTIRSQTDGSEIFGPYSPLLETYKVCAKAIWRYVYTVILYFSNSPKYAKMQKYRFERIYAGKNL